MGLFFYTKKGSIISTVDLPTTEIIEPQKAGTLAEAAFSLTNIFEEAQKVADIYLENVKMQTSNGDEGKKD
ncbi:hypothetical protein [Streptococcus alactolyticus]|uniref:hypothetical protein n=1 Tax=Streptococcus alactolyticus TaxID=29389 RepID=UPI003F9E7490